MIKLGKATKKGGAKVTTSVTEQTLVDDAGIAAALHRTVAEVEYLRSRAGYRTKFPGVAQTRDDGVNLYDLRQVLDDWAIPLGYVTAAGEKMIGYREIAGYLGTTVPTARWHLGERVAHEANGGEWPRDIPAPTSYHRGYPGPALAPRWLESAILTWIREDLVRPVHG